MRLEEVAAVHRRIKVVALCEEVGNTADMY
jgi:hypothetical protein